VLSASSKRVGGEGKGGKGGREKGGKGERGNRGKGGKGGKDNTEMHVILQLVGVLQVLMERAVRIDRCYVRVLFSVINSVGKREKGKRKH
jgi:hypothetical protein